MGSVGSGFEGGRCRCSCVVLVPDDKVLKDEILGSFSTFI